MDEKNLDKVLTQVLDVLGPYADQVVIGGGIALLIYRQYLVGGGEGLPKPAATRDVDLVVPRTLGGFGELLSERLLQAGFERETHSLETPPVESYVATFDGEEIALEFLTDRKSRGPQNENVLVAGVSAQPLSYVEMSQSESVQVTTAGGGVVRVVSAPAWMFHKALTFVKRSSKEKRYKDLYGIWYTGSQLGEFSEQSLELLRELAKKMPGGWRKTARKQLDQWVAKASPADWQGLEAQDPAQNLTRQQFVRFIEEVLAL